jgi:hypothetical protein
VGRKQSKRADTAIKNGECPLSMLTRRKLDRHGVSHSAAFVVWLCKQGTSGTQAVTIGATLPVLTKFYHPADIRRQLEFSRWNCCWMNGKRHGRPKAGWSKKEQKHG